MQYLIVDPTLPPPHENVLWSPKIDMLRHFIMGTASAVKVEVLEATGVIAPAMHGGIRREKCLG